LIVEEAAQILDMETLIPMTMSTEQRLKRVVLIGDQHQLPPILQNQSVQFCCRFDRSFFNRLIQLQYPSVQLNLQGRCKAEIASLFSWKYRGSNPFPSSPSSSVPSSLVEYDNLPYISEAKEYLAGNAGFYYSTQFIDVPYFQNQGESLRNNISSSSSYQNIGEAEYVVAVYQYMCLLGYPSERISILTTYQGQKLLIKEILMKRCQLGSNSGKKNRFSYPKHITTVDQFQGQQNDYVLLSLVRTESLGYLADIRRVIVAVSRARYGLYIFGYCPLFEKSVSWLPVLARLLQYPTKLTLIAGETYPTERIQDHTNHDKKSNNALQVLEVPDVTTMGILIYQLTQQFQA
jgi:intron-binding protein aquarius